MARRTRRWHPIGRWLKAAREDAGLTQAELATLTGISAPSVSRFESNRAEPSFGDICVIAQHIGWPLLYFATGRERRGDDVTAVVTELQYWGLRDVRLGKRVLLGEVRPFEELFADAAASSAEGRVLEALPALLLRNRFETQELLVQGIAYASVRRVGWLAEVADEIVGDLPLESVQPEARRRLRSISAAAWEEPTPKEPDYVGRLASKQFRYRVWENSPPLARRWKIACNITREQFVGRAKSILDGGWRGGPI